MNRREPRGDVRAWAAKAEEDFQTAHTMARKRKHPVPSVVGFHCQQCIEKYLKALLVQRRHSFPKTHELIDLLDRCLPFHPFLEMFRGDYDRISAFSVQFRYPGEDATAEEVKAALSVVRSLRKQARALLGVK